MKILLSLDGTPMAESVIPLTQDLARRWQAEVLLVRACDPARSMAPELPLSLREKLQQSSMAVAQEYLASQQRRFEELSTQILVPAGRPQEAIPRLAQEQDCGLIVLASHGRKGPERWLIGSVAEGILRRSHRPVLIVKPPAAQAASFQHILLPLDGSEASQRALQFMTPFLSEATRVTLLQCSGISLDSLGEEMGAEVTQHFLDQMAVALREVKIPGVQPDIVVCHGEPVEVIVQWALDHRCDLIAMSTQGRTGRPDSDAHRWLGSVTERVARTAHCAVLACPPPQPSR